MLSFKDSSKSLEDTDKLINELIVQNETLDRETASIFEELEITQEELAAFFENEKNFTKEQWAHLQKEKSRLDEKLEKELTNIRDLRKVKESYEEQKASRHWLVV